MLGPPNHFPKILSISYGQCNSSSLFYICLTLLLLSAEKFFLSTHQGSDNGLRPFRSATHCSLFPNQGEGPDLFSSDKMSTPDTNNCDSDGWSIYVTSLGTEGLVGESNSQRRGLGVGRQPQVRHLQSATITTNTSIVLTIATTMIIVSNTLTHLILSVIRRGRYWHLHFIDEEKKAEKALVKCPRSHIS